MSMNSGSQLSPFPMAFAASERPRTAPIRALATALAHFSPVAGICEFVRRRQVIYRLSCLHDRELADMGVNRSELHDIYKPDFERRRRS
jgi:uncharacterized protein YjiS (DUF1127 family)